MADDDLILAIDQGTTSSRAILFDRQGRIVDSAQRPLRQIFPADGQVEHDPEEIWADVLAVCRAVIGRLDRPGRVRAVGITNQRETTVVWDRRTGRAVHNAIVWQDRRTAEACRALVAAGREPAVTAKTGLVIDAYFSATKVAWILDHVPGARASAEAGHLAFGTVDSWLLYRLTGGRVHATDATNASRTLLFDIARQDWDDALLSMFGVPRAMLPEVRDSSGHFGDVEAGLLGVGLPVTGIAGDQQAATVGQACFRDGMVKSTYGTGCFALLNVGERPMASRHRMLSTVAYRIGGRTTYALEGSIFMAGATVQWLRDRLGVIGDAAETQALAESVDDPHGVYLVPAFVGLGAPHWDPMARGAILGLNRDTGRAHLARAALESVAFQTRDLMEAMIADSGTRPSALRVDGGMVVNDWMCQFLADMLDLPVERPRVVETTALGAASLAGLGAGLHAGTEALEGGWSRERRFEPRMAESERSRRWAGWREAVGRVLSRG